MALTFPKKQTCRTSSHSKYIIFHFNGEAIGTDSIFALGKMYNSLLPFEYPVNANPLGISSPILFFYILDNSIGCQLHVYTTSIIYKLILRHKSTQTVRIIRNLVYLIVIRYLYPLNRYRDITIYRYVSNICR